MDAVLIWALVLMARPFACALVLILPVESLPTPGITLLGPNAGGKPVENADPRPKLDALIVIPVEGVVLLPDKTTAFGQASFTYPTPLCLQDLCDCPMAPWGLDGSLPVYLVYAIACVA